MVRRAFTCRKGFGGALVAELRRAFPDGTHRHELEGLVVSTLSPEDAARVVSIAFAEQVAPSPVELKTTSIPKWGAVVARHVVEAAGDHPLRLHVFHAGEDDVLVDTVRKAAIEALPRELSRRLVSDDSAVPGADELLAQVILTGPRTALFSVVQPWERPVLKRVLSRFPGGHIHTPEDSAAPSRAFMKILQAEQHLGRPLRAGDTAADLGASPGGWSWLALHRGLHVTAVDRTPLREDLMAHPRLQFVRGDAFKWRPKEPVDWLLCDVIAFPERTVELLKSWLAARLCRRLIVSVKFKGEDDYGHLDDVKKILKSNSREWCVRHLPANRNEVTVIAECAPPEGIWS